MADLSKIIALKDDAAKYMVKEITHICKNLPKRSPGSEGEKQSIEYMAKQLKEECGCDKVHIDSFDVHPRSFFGWVYFTITFVLIAIAAFFFAPIISANSPGVISQPLFSITSRFFITGSISST